MSLRTVWEEGRNTLGAWIMSADPVIAEATARAGFDYVCVDQQHGTADYRTLVSMVQAIELGGSIPITRVTWNDPGLIGRALDAGAHGVIVPMVNTVAQAEAVVSASRYAPDGARSFGPVLPGIRHSVSMPWSIRNVTVIPMIETAEAISNLDAILAVPGIDAVYVGPADLSLTLGLAPGNNDGEAAFDNALATISAACQRHGVVAGIHSVGSLTERRIEQGFRMVTIASDLGALAIGYRAERDAASGGGAGSNQSMY